MLSEGEEKIEEKREEEPLPDDSDVNDPATEASQLPGNCHRVYVVCVSILNALMFFV